MKFSKREYQRLLPFKMRMASQQLGELMFGSLAYLNDKDYEKFLEIRQILGELIKKYEKN